MGVKLITFMFVLWQISFTFAKLQFIFQSISDLKNSNDPSIVFDGLQIEKLSKRDMVVSGIVQNLKDLPMMATIKIDTYAKTNNGYALSAGSVNNVPFCAFYQSDQVLIPDIIKQSNYTRSCPNKKGVSYVVNQLKIDAEHTIPSSPVGTYKTEITFQNMGKILAGLVVGFELKLV